SLPVSAKQVLDSKRNLHLILSIPSAILLVIAIVVSLSINIKDALLLIVFTTAFNIANAQIGLIFNLKLPNFKWTNEASVIKQSMSVLFTMLAGYAYGGLIILSAIFLKKFINVSYLLPIWSILTIIYVFILSSWLKTKGCKIFSNL
ncbi:MAG: hypothetical protein HUK23_06545, partial [Sphaerochaetaceae bacterium]|nr:hypothetical protein [Sphaerochaetaceae bacterium]